MLNECLKHVKFCRRHLRELDYCRVALTWLSYFDLDRRVKVIVFLVSSILFGSTYEQDHIELGQVRPGSTG